MLFKIIKPKREKIRIRNIKNLKEVYNSNLLSNDRNYVLLHYISGTISQLLLKKNLTLLISNNLDEYIDRQTKLQGRIDVYSRLKGIIAYKMTNIECTIKNIETELSKVIKKLDHSREEGTEKELLKSKTELESKLSNNQEMMNEFLTNDNH